jgi:adenosine deaminase
LLALAERHGVRPPAEDVEGVEAWYRFDGFPMFLDRYFVVLGLLRTPDDFSLIARRYLERSHADGVVHVEFHVSATGHIIENGADWQTIHDGIVEGCTAASTNTGISWGLIPDISPHLGADATAAAMEYVFSHDLEHVVAVGMGGPSDNWATDDFSGIFERGRDLGLAAVSHAGEHGGAEEVRYAVEHFGAQRIQHGIGAAQDPEVMQLLVDRDIALDVCPGSNLALSAVASAATHPLPILLDAGVTVTLGSDDPPMFQTDLLSEYRRAWEWCDLGLEGLAELANNSLAASLVPSRLKEEWTNRRRPPVGG